MTSPAPAPPPPSLATKLAYGVGAIPFGVKDNGFSYFLLIFYSQVVGLDARLVGLALTIALVLDAISDPIVGYWSDNLRSRWGRRHPFMYASAIPVAATYFLIWAPPENLSEMDQFWRLLTLAVLIRTFITFYETPSTALAPELTRDYAERSSLISWRYYFAWTGGNAMTVIMFAAIFPAFAAAGGQFGREAYAFYGIVAAVLIFAAIVASSLGTHSQIARLPPAPPARQLTLKKVFAELFETLADRSFFALFGATFFGAVATGLAASLTFYLFTFFWGFSNAQTGLITAGVFVSAIIGAVLAPIATRTIGKKRAAIVIGLVAFIGSPLPIVLRLMGLLPDDAPWVFWFVFLAGMIDTGLIVAFQILATSMIADLVEQAELKTGRRSEGVFFAAITFLRKLVTGLGVMAASLVLTWSEFPLGARPGEAPAEAINRMGALYVPMILGLWLAMLAMISTYKLTRESHEEALRQIAARRAPAE